MEEKIRKWLGDNLQSTIYAFCDKNRISVSELGVVDNLGRWRMLWCGAEEIAERLKSRPLALRVYISDKDRTHFAPINYLLHHYLSENGEKFEFIHIG